MRQVVSGSNDLPESLGQKILEGGYISVMGGCSICKPFIPSGSSYVRNVFALSCLSQRIYFLVKYLFVVIRSKQSLS